MRTRRDPPGLGTDRWGRPEPKYYFCSGEFCEEIRDLKCERKCDGFSVDLSRSDVTVFRGERLLVGVNCDNDDDYDDDDNDDVLALTCSQATISEEGQIKASDCINGKKIKGQGHVNVHDLKLMYEESEDYIDEIPTEESLTLSNSSQLRINFKGCVNTLSGECGEFYKSHEKDGRNDTAPDIYECYFNNRTDFVITEFDKEATSTSLVFFIAIPSALLVASCIICCCCNKTVEVADDGRMRMVCCGKYVSGIGNVQSDFDGQRPTKNSLHA